MTNKIKENIIIFWGGLAICLYIANSFEWIDISQWLQQVINYECNLEEITRKFIPILLTFLILIGIAKIIIVSFQLGQLSIPSARYSGRQEVKLLPSLPLDEQPCSEAHKDNFTSLRIPTTNERMQHIRDRHLQEQIALRQQIGLPSYCAEASESCPTRQDFFILLSWHISLRKCPQSVKQGCTD